jgi:type I restriction enzyme S subunit
MSWVDNSIDKIVTFQRGFDLPKNDFKEGDFPVVGSTGVIGYHNEYKVKSPCIVTGRSGTLGVFQYLNEDFWAHNTTLWVKDFQGNHPKFIYYLLQILDFKSLNGGVAVPTLNRNVLKNVFISYPKSLQTQKRIASILSAYDDLIENNLKRIKILEETAQNIYKEWFVNFRFPNYENTPFNEETGLPMGWKIKRVIDFFEFTKGIEVGSVNYENQPNFENLPFLRVGDISKRDGGIYVQKSLVKDKIIEKNDILISFDGSIGSVGFGLEGSYSSGLRKINSKDKLYGKGFTYCLVKSESIQNTIKAHAKGTTILHAGTSILHLEFPSATDKIMLDFNQISNPIFEQLVKLTSQNQKLKEARDILLPRLMNRTIEV